MAAKRKLPVEYHVEIYVGSFNGYPLAGMEASTAFQQIGVGDYIAARSFGGADEVTARLRVVELEHILWTIEGDHIGHKLMILTEEVHPA